MRWLGTLSCVLGVIVACIFGCRPAAAPTPPETFSPDALGSAFDPSQTGTIEGTITWKGPLPQVADLIVNVPGFATRTEPNPNRPRVNEAGAVANVIVFLREVDLTQSRPWDLPEVRAVADEKAIFSMQGGQTVPVGIVRQGGVVHFESKEDGFTSLRARGAAFFSLPFVKPGITSRSLGSPGYVELSQGAGRFWQRGHLFVSPHPYVALTDEKGCFHFRQVPAGKYEVCCLLPSWKIAERQVDPEMRRVFRLVFERPLQTSGSANVSPHRISNLHLSLGQGMGADLGE